ncbi:GrpB family protein [Listeria sp. FSL L7-1517]|uniref:GrpB family protein n=1 Tax=Listeria immobilis TaxID=2713502 RepID=UPI00164DF2B2|nr:GrpB family protein [Listeria immobilis]MBC6297273.1 GrpB family protein [Listeria immobilis]
MKVEIVDYQSDWKTLFEEEKSIIREIIEKNEVLIAHIGSTSVENLSAKPIIDILLVVNDLAKLDNARTEFEKIGYEYMGEFGLPGRRYMRKGGDSRTHQIHAYQFDSISEIQRHLSFRDYLRENKEIANEYAELKKALAQKYATDIEGYCDGKDLFIKNHEALALKKHWKTYQN